MKIGQNCTACGSDHWINIRQGKARCGVCEPAKINTKKQWPRMMKLQHREYMRKEGKRRIVASHTVAFSDLELAKCVGVVIEKIKGEQGSFFYKILPVMNSEFKTFKDAKGFFTKRQLA